jgi:hypothetical protein
MRITTLFAQNPARLSDTVNIGDGVLSVPEESCFYATSKYEF